MIFLQKQKVCTTNTYTYILFALNFLPYVAFMRNSNHKQKKKQKNWSKTLVSERANSCKRKQQFVLFKCNFQMKITFCVALRRFWWDKRYARSASDCSKTELSWGWCDFEHIMYVSKLVMYLKLSRDEYSIEIKGFVY